MADKEVIHVPGLSEAEEKANVPLSAAIKVNGFVPEITGERRVRRLAQRLPHRSPVVVFDAATAID